MSRVPSGSSNRIKSTNQEKKVTNGNIKKNNKKEESSSSDSDDEPLRAPIQLKVEFVNSIMLRQWSLAKKLCHFILMYEPNNNDAKQYVPLIDYMLAKAESPSSSSEDDDDDDDTNDDDSSESDSSSSESSLNEEKGKTLTIETETPKPVNASLSNKYAQHK